MIEGLKDTTHIVSHANCPDGIASAMICKAVLGKAKVTFVQYGTPAYEQLEAEPHMLFVDIAPPRERVEEFVKVGAIVLDHHKHAADFVELFGERGRFAHEAEQPGVSGALLAYRHVWTPLAALQGGGRDKGFVRQCAELTGIRDTWQTADPRWDEACAQAEAMIFHGAGHYVGRAQPWVRPEEIALGRLLLAKRRDSALEVARNAVMVGACAMFNERYASDVAEALRTIGSPAKVAVGFAYVCNEGAMSLIYSLRALDGETDVGALAKACGGGGHTAAAGFTLDGAEPAVGTFIMMADRAGFGHLVAP